MWQRAHEYAPESRVRLKMASPSLLALPSASAASMAFWISSCFCLGRVPPSQRLTPLGHSSAGSWIDFR